MSQLRADEYISVDLDLDELDITASEKVATYQQIKDYIMKKYGVKVHTSYIAQTKRKYGFGMRENYNKSKKENSKAYGISSLMYEIKNQNEGFCNSNAIKNFSATFKDNTWVFRTRMYIRVIKVSFGKLHLYVLFKKRIFILS